MKNPTIVIIGGEGTMGRAFGGLFTKAGCRVLSIDRETEMTAREACQQADILFFAVPISITPSLVAEYAVFAKPQSLIVDICSIKVPVVEAAEKYAPAGVEVLSLHPLFGPSVVSAMKNQVVAVCRVRADAAKKDGSWSEWLLELLRKNGALLTLTTPQKHDEMMAIIQGITHFSAIASAMALKDLAVDLDETLTFASPIYALRLAMVGRILSQSSQLYAEIEIENPATRIALKAYTEAMERLAATVSTKDSTAFQRYFQEAAEYLGEYRLHAQKETDAIIRFMSERGDAL